MSSKQTYDVQKATYTKDNGEVSDREIIVLSRPVTNIMALDVTKLDDHSKLALSGFITKQKEDLNAKLKELGAEWKAFKPDGLKIVA